MGTIRSIGNGRGSTGGDSFEQNFNSLQEVVRKLSEGNLTLQEALAAFEEGMALADRCGSMLEEAELRVKQVSDRTMRAGNVAARESALNLSPGSALDLDLDSDGRELVGLEIETYESTLIFEPLDKGTSGRSSNAGPARNISGGLPSQVGGKEGGSRDKPPARKPPSILDPLFDEDD